MCYAVPYLIVANNITPIKIPLGLYVEIRPQKPRGSFDAIALCSLPRFRNRDPLATSCYFRGRALVGDSIAIYILTQIRVSCVLSNREQAISSMLLETMFGNLP